jgi:hypothetical protein
MAIALAPEEQAWQARNTPAQLYLQHGNARPVQEQLRQSLAVTPNQVQTWTLLIQCFVALREFRETREWADRALGYGRSVQVFGRLRDEAERALRADERGPATDPQGSG